MNPSNLDYAKLTQLIDRTKTHVFLNRESAFLAALMCRLEFSWNSSIPTACASGIKLQWNPQWFFDLPLETRKTVLVHELWHPAELDGLRMGGRDPELWNIACDIRINNRLMIQGYVDNRGTRHAYSFEKVEWAWRNGCTILDQLGLSWPDGTPAERIYDELKPHAQPNWVAGFGDPEGGGQGDLDPGDDPVDQKAKNQQVIAAVIQAVTVAKMTSNGCGSIPGEIEAWLNTFLAPVVPWEVLLDRFFSDQLEMDYDWQVRDRRYSHVYLPGETMDEGRLEHLAYIFDTSGSFSDDQLTRCNSEVKHIWDKFQPQKLTLVQFDTKIQNVRQLNEGDTFNGLNVHGRGGTDLEPVRQWIQDNRPTCAIIFTDLDCRPMQPLDTPIPIVWLCVDNPGKTVPFGTLLHIES